MKFCSRYLLILFLLTVILDECTLFGFPLDLIDGKVEEIAASFGGIGFHAKRFDNQTVCDSDLAYK